MLHLLPRGSHRSPRIGSLLILVLALLIPAAPQLAPVAHAEGFLTPTDIPGTGGHSSMAVALGDLNSDGYLDIVLANLWGASQAVLGDGMGGFAEPTDIPNTGGRWTLSVALGDLNGDGHLDVIFGNNHAYGQTSDAISQVALGDGRGGFAAATDITGSSRDALSLALGDLNGDGKLDLVLGNHDGASQVALGDGAGGFATPTDIPGTGPNTYSIALGDLNGDTKLDLVLGNSGNTSQVALGNGLGSFATPSDISGTGRDTRSVALGDLNGDTKLDLVLGNQYSSNQVALGTGAGGFDPPSDLGNPTSHVAIGDLNGDGALDIFLSQYVSQVALGDGLGNFPTLKDIPGIGSVVGPMNMALGDLNGDGFPDCVFVFGNVLGTTSQVMLSDGHNGFASTTDIPGTGRTTQSVALGDLNGDSLLDVVLGNKSGLSQVALGDGLGGFTTAVNLPGTERNTYSALLGDLNADGKLDLILANNGSASQVMLGDGAGGFAAPTDIAGSGRNTYSALLGDLNGDGKLDLILGNNGSASQVVLGNGSGGFAAPTDIPNTGRDTYSALLGDLNGDGKLDLILGNNGSASQVALGNGSGGFAAATDIASTARGTHSLALGDLNADGKLDLVLGNAYEASQVALGNGLGGFAAATNIPGTGFATESVALKDLNADGKLDLVLANYNNPSQIALGNGAGGFDPPTDLVGGGTTISITLSLALGDLNGDGHIDLVLGNNGNGAASQVVLSDGLGGFAAPTDIPGTPYNTHTVALGDLNDDGVLDLVLGNDSGLCQVALGNGLGGFAMPTDIPDTARGTQSVALGDLNGDGTLDLVLGNWRTSQVALGDGLGGFSIPTDIFGAWFATNSVALGDLNNDGKLDLVLGNGGNASQVALGNGMGGFAIPTDIPDTTGRSTQSVALGDLNNDGRLDLILGNGSDASQVAMGNGQGGFAAPTDIPGAQLVSSVVLGDLNDDGNLDLVISQAYYASQVALGDGQGGFAAPADIPGTGSRITYSTALGDLNGDGKIDLVLGNAMANQVALGTGRGGFAAPTDVPNTEFNAGSYGVALGDLNDDGKLDIVFGRINGSMSQVALHAEQYRVGVQPAPPTISVQRPGPTPDAAGYATPAFVSGTIPITYTLSDPASQPVASVRAFFSRNGGGSWQPAIAATGTVTQNLSTSPGGTTYVFNWDSVASGFVGQSDNVVVRLLVEPQWVRSGLPSAYPVSSATSFPFRVRGTLVRVLQTGQPVSGATVYHLSAQQMRNGGRLLYPDGNVATTDTLGYLNSRAPLRSGDRLVAVAPIAATSTYTLALISAVPTSTGMTMDTVAGSGVQNLTVTTDHPLLLLNLDVSLEWDARSDPAFLSQLDANITRASELLFRWTNGQVALGDIQIFNDNARWDDAHIRIYASNRLRPNAVKGGIVEAARADPDRADLSYFPGQLRMGAIWNRYGEATSNLGDDWARVLAHEIGHYALFLDDNYLGQDADGRLISISSCPGPMSDPYRDDYGSFHPNTGWLPGCEHTLSQLETGRSDWATIQALYNGLSPSFSLKQPTAFAPMQMPTLLPIDLTRVIHDSGFSTSSQELPLDAPVLVLTDAQGQLPAPLPGSRARGVLFRHSDSGDLAIELGGPNVDQLLARGARVGDEVCVYELDQQRQGCVTVAANYQQLPLITRGDWQPDVQITPVTSTTLQLLVMGVPAGLDLRAQLFPGSDSARPAVQLTADSNSYRADLTSNSSAPAFDGLVRIWVHETAPRRETVATVRLGGNPGYSWANAPRGNPGYSWANAPVLSGDGQAILYGVDQQLTEGQFFAIQTVAVAPSPPSWVAPVGQAYRLSTTTAVPLAGASLNIGYLSDDVPQGQESGLQMYYWNAQAAPSQWEVLTTDLDREHNTASALVKQIGIYQLMTSVPLALPRSGWNLVPSYLGETQALPGALGGASGSVTTVYGYNSDSSAAQPWLIHDLRAPGWVNTLTQIENGGSYWIRATEPVTVPVRGTDSGLQTTVIGGGSLPPVPATYYGFVPVTGSSGGLTVQALIDDVVCGTATTAIQTIGDQSADAFAVTVRANSGEPVICGRTGATVTLVFSNGSEELARKTIGWQTDGAILVQQNQDLLQGKVFLPLLVR